MKKIIILMVLTFTYSAMSQSLSVFDVNTLNFPTIKAKFYAFDKDEGKKLSSETLKITQPNGGEKYLYSNELTIKWEGISEADTCILDYSLDNGVTWNRITDEAYGLQYVWKNIPKTNSDLCKIRIQQRVIFGKDIVSFKYSKKPLGEMINNVSWSPNGDRFAASTETYGSAVWNTDTGEFIYRLVGHSRSILNTTWNKDGSKILTVSNDLSCIIWDNISGKMLLKFDSLVNSIPNAKWSPDGNHIITIKQTKMVIRDANTGLQIIAIEDIPGLIRDVSWSPDGKKVVACFDNIAKVWNAITGEEIYTFTGHTATVKIMSWSPDGSKILTASGDLTVKIWDAYTGKEIYTIPIRGTIFNVSWSPNSKMIAINALSTDDAVRIWDAETGKLTHSFIGHRTTVHNIKWKPDGNQIISVSHDLTAKIWDVNNKSLIYTIAPKMAGGLIDATWSPTSKHIVLVNMLSPVRIYDVNEYNLESDLSDSVFSIVAPQPIVNDIDMKQELVGNVKDSLIYDFVFNNGNHPFKVDSISITGADADVFSMVSGFPPFNVNGKEGKTVEMRFIPNRVGLHQAQINVYMRDDVITRNIIGEGVQPFLVIENDLIDFGAVELQNFKDTLQVATIKNIGNAPIVITNTKHNYPNDKDFTTLSGGGNFTLLPNEIHKMDLRFTAASVGRTSGTLEFHYDGVGSPAVVQLFGQGLGGNVIIPDDSAYAGDRIKVKLVLGNEIKPKSNDLITNFKVILSYNPTLLYCDEPSARREYNKNLETIELSGKWDGTSSTLGTFDFIVGLGNADTTEITLDQFYWLDKDNNVIDFEVETQSGKFTLLGICEDGGTRLLNPYSKAGITSISPNPAENIINIELSLSEFGNTELSLYNLLGEKVSTIFSESVSQKSIIELNSDISKVGSGQYLLILRTPTYTETKQLLILR